jgi:hypothetical protein
LKAGDLVIVPSSAFSQDAYVGEVVSNQANYLRVKVPLYGDDAIAGRQVKWLARIQKRRLPTSLLEALEHHTSIYILSRLDRAPIYEPAFGSFIDLSRNDPDFIHDSTSPARNTRAPPICCCKHFSIASLRTQRHWIAVKRSGA